MTVVVQTPYNAHLANGVTTLFGFTFQLLDEGDLQVSLDGVVQMSGFTISGLGVQAGGSVTFSVAPANNVLVEIQRTIPLARSTDYQQNGDLPSATVDEDFDRIWQALQDAAYFAGLTVGLPAGDTAAPMVLPAVADRANRFFAFNALGEAIAALGTLPEVPVTDFGADLVASVDAAAARTLLELGTVATESTVPINKGGTGQTTASAAFNALKQAATETATGVVELATAAEVATGTDTTRAITPAALREGFVRQGGTQVTLTNQTAVDFSIPAGVKNIKVALSGVSGNGTSVFAIQIGDAGGVETTNYLGSASTLSSTAASINHTNGFFLLGSANNAATVFHGSLHLEAMDSNLWEADGNFSLSNAAATFLVAGSKTLSDTLTTVRLTHANGTDQFDAGVVNVFWSF